MELPKLSRFGKRSVAAPDYKTGVVYCLVEAQSRPEHDQRLAERFSTQQQKTL